MTEPAPGVTYHRLPDDPWNWYAPGRPPMRPYDPFELGVTPPIAGETVGAGVRGQAWPSETIQTGIGIARGTDGIYRIDAGKLVRDVAIPGFVNLGAGAILENCLITGPSTEFTNERPLVLGSPTGQKAEMRFCTVDPTNPSPYYSGIGRGLHVYRSHIQNVTDGVTAFDTATGRCRILLEGVLIENLTQFTPDYAYQQGAGRAETHNDCAQMQGNPLGDVHDLIIDGCQLNARHSTTKGDVAELHRTEIAALMLSPNVGSIHMSVTRSWLLGGIYCVNAGSNKLAGSELIIGGCRFERPGTAVNAPDKALAVDSTLQLVHYDNTYIDNGQPVIPSSA